MYVFALHGSWSAKVCLDPSMAQLDQSLACAQSIKKFVARPEPVQLASLVVSADLSVPIDGLTGRVFAQLRGEAGLHSAAP